ncbi:MAG: hypothetical protein KBS52_07120, partial [Clostridiales bacterium]|nr:hypothetical protein [Candidatus Equinaster intestinalis]
TDYPEFISGIYLYNQKHYFAFSKDYAGLAERVNKLITKYNKDGTSQMLLNLYGLTGFAK